MYIRIENKKESEIFSKYVNLTYPDIFTNSETIFTYYEDDLEDKVHTYHFPCIIELYFTRDTLEHMPVDDILSLEQDGDDSYIKWIDRALDLDQFMNPHKWPEYFI